MAIMSQLVANFSIKNIIWQWPDTWECTYLYTVAVVLLQFNIAHKAVNLLPGYIIAYPGVQNGNNLVVVPRHTAPFFIGTKNSFTTAYDFITLLHEMLKHLFKCHACIKLCYTWNPNLHVPGSSFECVCACVCVCVCVCVWIYIYIYT